MNGTIHDWPTRVLVSSESEAGAGYLVELTDHKVGDVYNGSCQCKHFIRTLRPRLRDPANKCIYRCKHIEFARIYCLDFMLEEMKKRDPNIPDDHQP